MKNTRRIAGCMPLLDRENVPEWRPLTVGGRHSNGPYGRWCAARRRALRTSVSNMTAKQSPATITSTVLPIAMLAATPAPAALVPIPVPYIYTLP